MAQKIFNNEFTFGQHREFVNDEFERQYVSWLLGRHNGNLSRAAKEAKMDRKHLRYLATKHNILQGFRKKGQLNDGKR